LPRFIYQPNATKRFILPQTFYIDGTRYQQIPFGVLSRELTAVLVVYPIPLFFDLLNAFNYSRFVLDVYYQ